jgi:hypothetical protein
MIFGRLDQVVSGGGGSPGRTPFPHETPGKHHA